MLESIVICHNNFHQFWGQQLLNALKALHAIRYNDEELSNINDEIKE